MNYFYSWVKGVVVISVIRVTACRPPSFAGGACLGTYELSNRQVARKGRSWMEK